MHPWLRGWRVWAVATLLALSTLVLRASVDAARSVRLAEEAAELGDFESTVLHLRHAAQWYVPFVGTRRTQLERIIELGDTATTPEAQLFAWRSARGAILSVRHFRVPNADLLPELHQRIGQAMAIQAQQTSPATARSAAEYAAELDAWRERQPAPLPAFLASLAFVGWISALALAAWRGISSEGRLRRELAGWLVLSALLLVSWVTLVRVA